MPVTDPTTASPEASVLHASNPWAATAALGALAAAAFTYVTTESLPVGLLEPISSSLRASLTATGLLVTVYAAINVVLSAPLAALTKGLPRKTLICCLIGALVLTSLAAAAAPGYGWLMAVRILTALGQAVFWSVVIPTAASLFPPAMTGRAVASVLGGASLAVVAGVPAFTWVGQEAGWRAAFAGVGALALVVLVPVVALLPSYHPAETHAGSGSSPDRRRYWLAMLTTALTVGAFFCAYTYVSPFLTRVAGLALHQVPEVLLLTGASTALGVLAGAATSQRLPSLSTLLPVVVIAPSLLALYFAGSSPPVAVGLMASAALGIGAYDVSNQNRILQVAPGSTDIASAWASASFNAGIAGGSLAGGLALHSYGARSTALLGALVATAALAAAGAGSTGGPGGGRARPRWG
jgi:DHA1 family inner membrane transport protein